MEKKRKKLTDQYGETKVRTVWLTNAKIGTTASVKAYFFDEPSVGAFTQVVIDSPHSITHTRAIGVMVDSINELGLVFCSRF